MTVESTARKQSYSGGQASLDFTFKVLPNHPEHVKVIAVTSGTETALVYGVGYTVDLESDGVGGTVTVSPTYSTQYTYTVYRETEDKQESDYDDYNQFPADTLEADLDRRTLVSQENKELSDRTVSLPISTSGVSTELPVPVADTYLAWNGAGTALENKTLPSNTLVKATQTVAEAGTNDTDYMTALQVKNEVQKASLLSIPDTNLAQITTASKVSGAALTSLASIPSGAGVIPAANVPTSSTLKCHVGYFDRDMTAATGAVAYTGTGFAVKALSLTYTLNATTYGSGYSDGTNDSSNGFYTDGSPTVTESDESCILAYQSGTTAQTATVNSFDSNGFTFGWTRVGATTTGTLKVKYIALG